MSDRYQCIRCWRRLEVLEALYRCNHCDSRRTESWMQRSSGSLQRVRDLPRSLWSRLNADDEERFACPRDGKDLQLLCECEQPFTSLAKIPGAKSFGLGFAGAHGAGKTLLIATMVDQFRREAQTDHRIDLLGIDGTEERFGALRTRLIDNRQRPQSTHPEASKQRVVDNTEDGQPRNFGWQIQLTSQRGRARQVGLLTVYDVAGETWSEPVAHPIELFDRYLSHLTALVFLVDGAPMAEDLDLVSADAWDPKPLAGDRGSREREWLSRMIERLGERCKEVDLALVVSKADLLWQHPEGRNLQPAGTAAIATDRAQHEATLADLLSESGRGDLVRLARGRFRRVALFAASSLGFTPAVSDVRGDTLTKQLSPVDVVEPLQWLFEQQVPRYKR